MTEPAPVFASFPIVTGATNMVSEPMLAPSPITVRCLSIPIEIDRHRARADVHVLARCPRPRRRRGAAPWSACPTVAFFRSTNAPALDPSSSTVPGRIRTNGPTRDVLADRRPEHHRERHLAPVAHRESTIRVDGPDRRTRPDHASRPPGTSSAGSPCPGRSGRRRRCTSRRGRPCVTPFARCAGVDPAADHALDRGQPVARVHAERPAGVDRHHRHALALVHRGWGAPRSGSTRPGGSRDPRRAARGTGRRGGTP